MKSSPKPYRADRLVRIAMACCKPARQRQREEILKIRKGDREPLLVFLPGPEYPLDEWYDRELKMITFIVVYWTELQKVW